MTIQFHAFTQKHDGLTNRIITQVKVTQAFDPHNPPTPPPSLIETAALWDTGATNSVITPSLATDLGLVPTGTTIMNSARGSGPSNTYLVNLYLPNQVCVPGVRVVECEDTAHFGAIIGMDIIAAGDFSITNLNGKTWLSFRIPSVASIDYVAEAQKLNTQLLKKITTPRVGRNDPCACGSGKKYKKCCGAP